MTSERPPPDDWLEPQLEGLSYWRRDDHRTFGDILSEFQSTSHPNNVRQFIGESLGHESLMSENDFFRLITDSAAPNAALIHLIASVVPPSVASNPLTKNRGFSSLRQQTSPANVISASETALSRARIFHIQRVMDQKPAIRQTSFQYDHPIPETSPAEWNSSDTTGVEGPSATAHPRFATAIRFLRLTMGFTQAEFSRMVGNNVAWLEFGNIPSNSTCSKIYRLLRVLPEERAMLTLMLETAAAELETTPRFSSVVRHFEADGLTADVYLKCLRRLPRVIESAPSRVIDNIEAVLEEFSDLEISRQVLLRAACSQPRILCQPASTTIRNVQGVVNQLSSDGLELTQYVKAACRSPTLFCQRASRIVDNIQKLTQLLGSAGATQQVIIQIACRQPNLFYQKHETLCQNIEHVCSWFQNQGINRDQYLQALLRQPQLMCRRPSTLIEHLNLWSSFCEPKERSDFLSALLNRPEVICLSEDNIYLRVLHARLTNCKPSLRTPRGRVEAEIEAVLAISGENMSDASAAIGESSELGSHTRNVLLRALIRNGYIRGRLD